MNTLIAFDDTGSPGKSLNSKYLDSERKTYVGVLFEPNVIDEVRTQMNGVLGLFKDELKTTECHLTEIMNGQGEWAKIDSDMRLGIFSTFCEIFSHYKFTCLVQSWAPSYYARNNISLGKGAKYGALKLYEHSDMAMFMALIKAKHYLIDNDFKTPVSIIFDEGRRKAGSEMVLPLLRGITKRASISFERSSGNPFLQIADFAAYCLNKSQLLAVKEKRSEIDDLILKCIELADFNYVGAHKIDVKYSELNSEHYDYMQRLYMDSIKN
ncbi:DUF3800 domain-containing protein [Aeromonas sp. s9]|uniref:DUF3800 domain-containing protein n=1 Tax=Aeromonas sp. s9 TaxID=3138490 RepID=UPI0034A17673